MTNEEFLDLIEAHADEIKRSDDGKNLLRRLYDIPDNLQFSSSLYQYNWFTIPMNKVWYARAIGKKRRQDIHRCMVEILGLDPNDAPEGSWFRDGPLHPWDARS